MSGKYGDLKTAYIAEMRIAKQRAEAWWADLKLKLEVNPGRFKLKELWPMGPASHPWVIATYRKYYLLCDDLNESDELAESSASSEDTQQEEHGWGVHKEEEDADGPVAPQVLLHELLYGGDTQDLAEFVEHLVFIPIGLQDGQSV